MNERTRRLWDGSQQHPGDRHRLIAAVADAFDVSAALYPGCYVDITPSFVLDSVTYLDTDRRAGRFFADTEGVDEIIGSHRSGGETAHWTFLQADYTSSLALPEQHYDLLLSLYAGFVSEHCTRHLRPGGLLLVNPSHGDAALASLDPRYELVAAVTARDAQYTVRQDELDTYLIPRRDTEISRETLHATNRGIAYTKPAFAYLFRLSSPAK
jgi:hypothetical protein